MNRAHAVDPSSEGSDNPPAANPDCRRHTQRNEKNDPQRDGKVGQVAGPHQNQNDNAHRFRNIAGSVTDRQGHRGNQLSRPKCPIDLRTGSLSEPEGETQREPTGESGENRCDDQREQNDQHAARLDHLEPADRDAPADQSAQKGVRRARRNTEARRNRVPDDRREEGRAQASQGDSVRVDDPGADDHRHRAADEEWSDEVGGGSQDECAPGSGGPGRDDRSHQAPTVVVTIQICEDEREGDQDKDGIGQSGCD